MVHLDHILVRDAMHPGILSCSADAPLGEVAELMASRHVHAVAISESERTRPDAVVSALDVVAAIASGAEPSAAQVAATEPLSIPADETLARAAQLMSEYSVSHLVVLDHATGHPIGVLSTLDIAAVYAAHRED